MKFSAVSAMKHIKYLEEEKQMVLEKEANNSTIVELDSKIISVEPYSFLDTRDSIRNLDNEISAIKHAMNLFNTTTEVVEGLTVDKALVRLAQYNNELHIVRTMKGRAKETVEERYSSNSIVRRVNYDLREVEHYYQSLIKEVHELQMNIDRANLLNTFEVEL